MAKAIPNSRVEDCLRKLLEAEEYKLSPWKLPGQTGVDILATEGDEQWYIEVIGYKRTGPARAKDFYESFFRAVSRLNDGATHCVIAQAKQARVGLPARAKQHHVAWSRIAQAFPELEIWLVDTEACKYERTLWGDWLED